ncbi:ferric reductase-like transmembrane domain-containing protein [Quadrisphaera setariae]|uniref:Ferric reductase n=1 Tax=Quadrisphaera setariae TaxID=2593304 RepID=A0A5C8ZAN7_9ACTN|nr:ferric reductase-like transmembrane domain-containing protein [Quadrisphaera setariae]TXR55022.1 ferric reductase [Quadrisphaera setariae]
MSETLVDAAWYLGRGTGVSALVLFTAVVVAGVLVRRGEAAPGLSRAAVAAVHRWLGLSALAFLVVHVATMLVDPYAQLQLVDVVVPFLGAWNPFWLGLGTLTLDLVAALVVTSLLRHRLGHRTWRAVHWAAYLCWPSAVLHTLGTGTDAGTWWMTAVVVACTAAVGGAVVLRLLPRRVALPSAAAVAGTSRAADLPGGLSGLSGGLSGASRGAGHEPVARETVGAGGRR